MKAHHLKLVDRAVMRPVRNGRKSNAAYRVREHLTESEMDKLLAALKQNRYGHRDWLIGLVIYRQGLRVSEACDLRWGFIDSPYYIAPDGQVGQHAMGAAALPHE